MSLENSNIILPIYDFLILGSYNNYWVKNYFSKFTVDNPQNSIKINFQVTAFKNGTDIITKNPD
jgi:hypothetical protein